MSRHGESRSKITAIRVTFDPGSLPVHDRRN
jgi:hypothetical protein